MESFHSLGCEFAALRQSPVISLLQTSRTGNLGPYPDSEEEKVITVRKAFFLKNCLWKEIAYFLSCTLSGGVLWLVFYWYPRLLASVRYEEVAIEDPTAELILIESVDDHSVILGIKWLKKDRSGRWFVEEKNKTSWSARLSPKKEPEKASLLTDDLKCLRIVEWRHIRLWYNPITQGWHQLTFGPSNGDFDRLHEVGWKLSQANDKINLSGRQYTYGKNTIEVEVQSFAHLLFQEALTPFVAFQIYSVVVWFYENYISYSLVLVFMTVTTITYSAYQLQQSQKSLALLAKADGEMQLARFSSGDWNFKPVQCASLVPGDLVMVFNGMICPCDMILLSGQCIANEAMLTGESAPIIKEPLPLEGRDFNPQTNRALKYMLLSGSTVMLSKASSQPPPKSKESQGHSVWDLNTKNTPVLAMVLRTGCETAKGKLIQTIQFPQDSRGFAHRQREEAEKFIVFLLIATVIACGWFVFYAVFVLGMRPRSVVIDTLDLTTILVPAALPLVLSVGVAFAFESLKERRIHTSSTTHIVTAGHVDCICYDKTGTLTTEGDTFVGIHTVSISASSASATFQALTRTVYELPRDHAFRYILAACHSLTYLFDENEKNGKLIGEQLELEMFCASGWEHFEIPKTYHGQPRVVMGKEVPSHCTTAFLPPGGNSSFLAVVRISPFDAELRTMSTIVLALDPNSKGKTQGRQLLLVKGAPEAMKERCTSQSLPKNFDEFLEAQAREGYRILGCAVKELNSPLNESLQESRGSLEKDLTFCGFLIMGNQLKPETKDVLNQVQDAGLRQCMVTGDNVLTALAVAKQCDGAFVTADCTYVLDYPSYNHDLEELPLSSFALSCVPHGHTLPKDQYSSFEELLQGLDHGASVFSMALTGNAFSALIDIHESERPNDLGRPVLRSRARSRFASTTSLTGRLETPLQQVLSVANVYARCKPHEKQMLMIVLQKLAGHYVCMVGDGANDSFALKTADIGLSISSSAQDEERLEGNVPAAPSIAAPFSTPISNIGPVADLLREGRAALASSIIAFRYMVHYGLAAITQVIILYANGMKFSGRMWVVGDLFINLPLAIVLNTTACSKKLVAGVPETAIMSWRFGFALTGHFLIIIMTQLAALFYLRSCGWYSKVDDRSETMEVTIIFWISVSQYVTSGMALSHDYAGFRAPWFSNKLLVATFGTLVSLILAMILGNEMEPIRGLFLTVYIPQEFCWHIIGFLCFSCMLHIVFELSVSHKAKSRHTFIHHTRPVKDEKRKLISEQSKALKKKALGGGDL